MSSLKLKRVTARWINGKRAGIECGLFVTGSETQNQAINQAIN